MEVDPAEYTLSVQAPGYASSSDTLTLGRGKGPRMAKSIALAADASRLASLLLSYIPAVCAFVAPRQPSLTVMRALVPRDVSLHPAAKAGGEPSPAHSVSHNC